MHLVKMLKELNSLENTMPLEKNRVALLHSIVGLFASYPRIENTFQNNYINQNRNFRLTDKL